MAVSVDNSVSKSWFAVFNRPFDHGYSGTPVEICERLKEEWCSVSDTRTGAWLYCVSEDGMHHVHMVLEDIVAMRFSKIKREYAVGMHFEATKGNKQQAEDYVNKTGKWEEKGEQILYKCVHGDIKGAQGRRSDLAEIEELLEQGKNPKEIVTASFSYYRYENMIKKAYFDMRDRDTPSIRAVKVIWHTGESGTGKSYSRLSLEEEVGAENIFYLTDYNPNSMFDGYYGQKYLWIEDFKGEIKFSDILRILDIYKCDLHARYTNGKALWEEVHITSIMHPCAAYLRMVPELQRKIDTVDQLLRRISCIRYHYRFNAQFMCKDFPATATIEAMKHHCRCYGPYSAPERYPIEGFDVSFGKCSTEDIL